MTRSLPACPDQQALVAWIQKHGTIGSREAIETHAAGCADCRRSLSELAKLEFSSKGMSEGASAGLAVLRRGSLVDRYVILDVIGAGAMGVVYAAYDPELDRKIALKVIRSRAPLSASANVAQARLAREAQAMAKISHPNVVSVYDAGPFGSEVFVAMELVEGVTLRRWLSEEPRSFGATVEALLAAGKGLAAVHRAGLVHRDFKPDNVLVAHDGRVLVTDFGLARPDKVVDEQARVVGTPAYMAPEQRKSAAADARSDQFSFCVALFEAVYGERPFEVGTSEDVVRAMEAGVLRPSRSRRRAAWLLPILQRGLCADPAARFPDMETLLAALARDPARRRQRVGGIALAMVVVAGLSIAIGRQLSARRPDCGRVGEALTGIWDPARREAIRATFFALDVPGKERSWEKVANGFDAYTRDWLSHRRATCEAANARFGDSDQHLALQNRCLDRRLSSLRALSELFAKATPTMVENAAQAVTELLSPGDCEAVEKLELRAGTSSDSTNLDDDRLWAQLYRARLLGEAGLNHEALALANSTAREAEERQSSVLAEALFRVGDLRKNMDHLDEEVAAVLRRAALLSEATGDDEVRVRALIALVYAMIQFGSPTQLRVGHHYAEEAKAVLKRLGGAPRFEVNLMIAEGSLLMTERRNDEALVAFDRALLLLDSFPENERDRQMKGSILNNQGAVYYSMHRFEEVLRCLREALSIRENMYGRERAAIVVPLSNIGDVLNKTGRYAEAEMHLERALAVQRRNGGSKRRREVRILTLLATTMDAQGKPQRALSLYLEALAIAEREVDRADPKWGELLLGLGKYYLRLDQPTQAISYLERGLAGMETTASPMDLADLRFTLARALAAVGRDAPRVDELAAAARAAYATDKWESELAEVDGFLEGRRAVKR